MKRKLVFSLFLLALVLGFSGCEGLLGNCKYCELNTYENGNLILTQSEGEYCDSELITIQATPDQTTGNTTVKWECR